MKFRLTCLLFGHYFIQSQDYKRESDGVDMIRKIPVDYCIKCGLSKKELGIE